MLGLERFYEGRFQESLALVEEALAAYDPVAHRDLAHRFGHDPRAGAANYKAWNLWHLGLSDRAAATIEENLRWIREVDHANTTGNVLCFGTMTNIWLRQPDRVEAAAREARRLAEEMTLPLWHAWASIHLGWALSQRGAAPGLDEIEAGLREARAIGAGRFEPFNLGLAAEAYTRAGRRDEAWASLAEAFAALAQGHHQAFAADLHRLRGRPVVAARARVELPRPRRTFAGPWRSHASRSRPPWSCAPRPASPGCGPSGASAGRPRPARAGLRPVQRRVRHTGPDRRQGAARRALTMQTNGPAAAAFRNGRRPRFPSSPGTKQASDQLPGAAKPFRPACIGRTHPERRGLIRS